MAAADPLIIFLRVVICLSQIGSLFILLTGIVFWDKLTRGKTYMQLLMMISISDLIGCHMIMYQPETHDFCRAQGFLWTFFIRASWLWCTLIPVTLFTQIKMRFVLSMPAMHGIVWGINGFITALPEVFGTQYGGNHNQHGHELCTFEYKSTEPRKIADWYVCIIIVPCLMLAMIGVVIVISLKQDVERRYKDTEVGVLMSKLINDVAGYPIGLAVFWVPFYCLFILFNEKHVVLGSVLLDYILLNVSGGFAFQFGFFMAIFYFVKSREARSRWRGLINDLVYGPSRDDGLDGEDRRIKRRASARSARSHGVAELDAVNTDLIPEASEPDFDRDEDVAERLSAGEALSGEAGAQNSDRTSRTSDNDNANDHRGARESAIVYDL